jgi:hypothetical protein
MKTLVIVPDRGKEAEAEKISKQFDAITLILPSDKPSNYDVNDYAKEYGSESLSALIKTAKSVPLRFKIQSGEDVCSLPDLVWLVRKVLTEKSLSVIYGPSGSGKSFLVIELACAMASGEHWFNFRVKKTAVFILCLEGAAGMSKRIKAWGLFNNKAIPSSLHFITQTFNLLTDVSDLAKAILASGGSGGVVIIDTLNRATAGSDENSSQDMGMIISCVQNLQTLIDGTVLLVHHTGKDQSRGLRGHSSLFAAMDAAIEVTKTDTQRAWSIAKSKDDMTGDCYPFNLKVIEVGVDAEGEVITSCVVVPDDSGEVFMRKRVTLSSNQAIAQKALGDLLRNSNDFGKQGAPVGRPCADYEQAVSVVSEFMPTDSKHKRERAKEAIKGLVAKGILGMRGEWLWDI